ncbi:hypothetical protein [Deinococcus maricopensis]|uniref:Uncharacterized protein n=1 Tax=Deinococcus maricopensis (strain DSM 21211 / LMG 22137 / NRRL B-23946 / LB-34) TaxID=709986 RepID=E8UAY5_DEIML|nr:hypothetical protein [Deinococcus maricopensis]ADV68224.1 hypothetical protein Deima_2591 [Deinococcus maricopensis DSM 21211]
MTTSKERDLEARLEAAFREHQTATLVAVTLGIVIGVGVAAYVLNRTRRPMLRMNPDDPEQPLFI